MPRSAFRSPLPSPPPSPSPDFLARKSTALPAPRHRHTLSSTVVDESVAMAAALVEKWHPDAAVGCSLFFDGRGSSEAKDFLRGAAELHRAMLFFASDVYTHSGDRGEGLMEAQTLLETAMRRLELELRLLLSSLDSKETHDDNTAHNTDTVSDIRAIAEAMMAAGYGKECVSAFKSRRHGVVDGTLQRLLGFSASHHRQIHKLSWDQVDAQIKSWLSAMRVAFKSLFTAERALCDSVFAGDSAVGDAVFTAIANEQATNLLAVAGDAAARARRAPERLFRVLDIHDTITELVPAIESVFGDKSEVASCVAATLGKAGEEASGALASFEAAIQKEPSKATTSSGGVHPITRYVMNYLVFLADYEEAVAYIYGDARLLEKSAVSLGDAADASVELSSLLMSPSSPSSSSNPIAWLVFVLQCKLEAKAGSYRDAALSYLFLANNVHYIVKKVAGGKLERILGEEWAAAHKSKERRYVDIYVRAAWGKVVTAMSTARGAEGVEKKVMEAVEMQEKWEAADEEMAEAVRVAGAEMVVPTYRVFYRRYGAEVSLTPGDVNGMITRWCSGSGSDHKRR